MQFKGCELFAILQNSLFRVSYLPYLKLQRLFAVIHLSPPCNRISEKVTFSALPMAGQSGYDSVSEKVILSFWDMSEKGMSF